MTRISSVIALRTKFLSLGLLLFLGSLTSAQSVTRAITLAKQDLSELHLSASEQSFLAHAPANYRYFGTATVGEMTNPQTLTLQFALASRITKIASTPDFKIIPGGTCEEDRSYQVNTTCSLLVQFTPQGPGRRLGKLAITHDGSVHTDYVGLGGNSYSPVVSFTPSVITTVPNAPVINGAFNIATDAGDTLYIADTGNNVIRLMDSSGAFKTVSGSGVSAPVGVAADPFGEIYFSEPAANLVYEIFEYGSQLQLSGVGTDACTVAAPCSMTSEKVYTPGMMAMDSGNQLFFEDGSRGAAVAVVQPYPATLARLYDPFTYQTTNTGVFGVDAYDNLYTAWLITGLCQINTQTYSDAANSRAVYKKVAGGKFCGFGGDGGQARNAEISGKLGQFAFDITGNMYFTDTLNERVRRIDYSTGIIRTIAGNGTSGYKGDNGPGTISQIAEPSGIAVDSQGQVYFLHNAASTGNAQVIRKLGVTGALSFPSTAQGSSFNLPLLISNTGNSVLNVVSMIISGTNASDFAIDPATTNCNLLVNGLANGQSCQLGIVFKPGALGTRSATLTLADNTVTGFNKVTLKGTGTAAAIVTITSPVAGQAVPSTSNVTFSASVTAASGPAPTGQVKFKVDGNQIGSAVSLVSGTATVTAPKVPAGTHTLVVTYSGDNHYATANVSQAITIQ